VKDGRTNCSDSASDIVRLRDPTSLRNPANGHAAPALAAAAMFSLSTTAVG
jgi:hypothetical protein